MDLTKTQELIFSGKICPYCKQKTEFVDSSIVYGGKSFGMIYLCRKCDAYCGVHKNTKKSLGRLANEKLRKLKKEAHEYFDMIWQSRLMSRKNAYKLMSDKLNLPIEYTHIGMFSEKTCENVIYHSKQILKDNKLKIKQKQF
jgi:hypothetical protein